MFDQSNVLLGLAIVLGPVLIFAVTICCAFVYDPKRASGKHGAASTALAFDRERYEEIEEMTGEVASPPLVPDIAPMKAWTKGESDNSGRRY